jgi:hypothetical protein
VIHCATAAQADDLEILAEDTKIRNWAVAKPKNKREMVSLDG